MTLVLDNILFYIMISFLSIQLLKDLKKNAQKPYKVFKFLSVRNTLCEKLVSLVVLLITFGDSLRAAFSASQKFPMINLESNLLQNYFHILVFVHGHRLKTFYHYFQAHSQYFEVKYL